MRDAANIREVSRCHLDMMGFIFYKTSPRYCRDVATAISVSLPGGTERVAVTVNMEEDELLRITDDYGFRVVQLHGDEEPEICGMLRDRGLTVIKAKSLKTTEDIDDLKRYSGVIDYFLFDTPTSGYGGSGRKFDWRLLEGYNLEEDFILSGGIGEEDADEILRIEHPCFAGIDLNSRFEISPGLKDAGRIERFIEKIRRNR